MSIGTAIFSNFDNISHGKWNGIISFFHYLSNYEAISDPFSVFIEILSSIGGVFFGIKIGQGIDDRKELEQLSDLWYKIHHFLKKMRDGIDDSISIYELAEYKMYWDSLQRADNVATRFLQSDNKYIDIAYTFSFLTFYSDSWQKYYNINVWKDQASTTEKERIQNWINKLDRLIIYTKNKSET